MLLGGKVKVRDLDEIQRFYPDEDSVYEEIGDNWVFDTTTDHNPQEALIVPKGNVVYIQTYIIK